MDRGAVIIVSLIGAIGMFIIAYVEYETYSVAKAKPQSMTLATLASDGPGDNRHVIISDFKASAAPVIINGQNSMTAYVPLESLDAVETYYAKFNDPDNPTDTALLREEIAFEPETFPLLVQMSRTDEVAVRQVSDLKSIQGILYTGERLLDGDEQRYLKKYYPKQDFDSLWMLLPDKKPPEFTTMVLLFGVSGACLLVLIGALLWPKRKRASFAERDIPGGEIAS